MRVLTVCVLTALAAVACSETEQAPAQRETVFDPLVETVDRARQVDDIARSRTDALDEQIEAADGADEP